MYVWWKHESEEDNAFMTAVLYYMEEHNCTQEDAIKAIEKYIVAEEH